jgi:hypothetical protein
MSNVALYSVTRSSKPEDLFADAWDAVVELTEKAESAGCAVPDSDDDDDNLVQASVPLTLIITSSAVALMLQ